MELGELSEPLLPTRERLPARVRVGLGMRLHFRFRILFRLVPMLQMGGLGRDSLNIYQNGDALGMRLIKHGFPPPALLR